jgi:hypothetical protein
MPSALSSSLTFADRMKTEEELTILKKVTRQKEADWMK